MKKPKKIEKTASNDEELTFTVPHVLLAVQDSYGRRKLTVREGGYVQIKHTVTIDWYDQPVDESANVFALKGQNQINFGGLKISVLNDKIPNVAPSSPTATEYMKLVGKRVMLAFSCVKSVHHEKTFEREAYRVVRSTIILP